MSDNQQDSSGVNSDTSGDQNQDSPNNKEALAKHAAKLLSEKKQQQKENEALKAQLKELQDKDLEVKGKQSELIESLRKDVKIKDEKIGTMVQQYASNIVASKFKEEAIKQGCSDLDLLMKAVDFSTVEVNADDWSINPDDLKRTFENTMQKHPLLFNKSGPKIVDGKPVGQVSKKTFSEMSQDELKEAWKQLK